MGIGLKSLESKENLQKKLKKARELLEFWVISEYMLNKEKKHKELLEKTKNFLSNER